MQTSMEINVKAAYKSIPRSFASSVTRHLCKLFSEETTEWDGSTPRLSAYTLMFPDIDSSVRHFSVSGCHGRIWITEHESRESSLKLVNDIMADIAALENTPVGDAFTHKSWVNPEIN